MFMPEECVLKGHDVLCKKLCDVDSSILSIVAIHKQSFALAIRKSAKSFCVCSFYKHGTFKREEEIKVRERINFKDSR